MARKKEPRCSICVNCVMCKFEMRRGHSFNAKICPAYQEVDDEHPAKKLTQDG